MSKPSLLDQLLTATEMCGRLRERVYTAEENHRNTEAELRDAQNTIHNLEARIKDLESAKPPVQFTLQVPTKASVSNEDSWVTVRMNYSGDRKIDCIKLIRIYTGLGLKETKDFVEGTPTKIHRDMFADLCGADFQTRFPSTLTVIE
jgi:ribosomal protein L7/L12